MKKAVSGKSKKIAICQVRQIRKDQRKSIVDLAELSGIPQSKIIYIESGKGEGLPSTHIKLAKTLGVSLDEYFGYATLESTALEQPEMIASDQNFSVEQLAPLPASEISVKRLQLAGRKECNLSRYLNLKKPAFFYLSQGDGKIWINQKEQALKAGDHVGLSTPGKIRVENLSNLGLILLIIQP